MAVALKATPDRRGRQGLRDQRVVPVELARQGREMSRTTAGRCDMIAGRLNRLQHAHGDHVSGSAAVPEAAHQSEVVDRQIFAVDVPTSEAERRATRPGWSDASYAA